MPARTKKILTNLAFWSAAVAGGMVALFATVRLANSFERAWCHARVVGRASSPGRLFPDSCLSSEAKFYIEVCILGLLVTTVAIVLQRIRRLVEPSRP
jgi:hypothetical protein